MSSAYPPSPGPATQPNQFACPQCHYMDQVQKVSSVFGAGTASSAMSGTVNSVGFGVAGGGGAAFGAVTNSFGTASFSGQSQTMLSRHLAPPPQPTYRSPWGVWSVLGLIACLVGLSCTLPYILSGIAYSTQGPRTANSAAAFGVGGLICSAAFLLGAVAIVVGNVSAGRSRMQRVRQQMPIWEMAYARWHQLYYCHRCDGVFAPGRTALIPTPYMPSYLFQSAPTMAPVLAPGTAPGDAPTLS